MLERLSREEAKARGLSTYISKFRCGKARHRAERRVANGHCVECEQARAETRRAARRDKARARVAARKAESSAERQVRLVASRAARKAREAAQKAARKTYYAANRERLLAKAAAWRAANRDKMASARAAWEVKNPGRTRALIQAWRARNPEKVRAYRINHPEMVRACYAKRRATLLSQRCGCCTDTEIAELHAVASLCGRGAHVDHKIPLALGGHDCVRNLQVLTDVQHREKTRLDMRNIADARRRAKLLKHWSFVDTNT